MSPRIAQIFRTFAADREIQALYPKETKILATIEPHVNDYGVRRTLERYNFGPFNPAFAEILVEYWKKHFFGNDYLKYDTPYPGALSFVQDLHQAGAEIYYLTGRDIPRMNPGTVASLKQHGFPINTDHSNLVLKPQTGGSDSEFKKDFFIKMDHSEGPVWFFENEPANIFLVAQHCPHIKILFVETVHSESMPPPSAEVPRITGFE